MLDHFAHFGLFIANNKLALKFMSVLKDGLLLPDFGETGLELFHGDAVFILAFDSLHQISLLIGEYFGLLLLQSVKLTLYVGVVEVKHVRAVVELGELIVAPLLLFKHEVLLHWDVEISGAAIFLLKLLHCWPLLLCGSVEDCLGHESWSVDIVPLFGLSDVEPVQNGLLLFGVFGLLGQSMIQQDVASFAFNVSDAISRNVRHLD